MKKVLLSLAMMLTCVMTQAQLTDNWWEDHPRFTADELNEPVERLIAIKGVWKLNNEWNYNKFYRGTNTAIKNNPVAKDALDPENIFIWEPTGDGRTHYLKKAYGALDHQAYMRRPNGNNNIGAFGAKTADDVIKFVIGKSTDPTMASTSALYFTYTNASDPRLETIVRLKVDGQNLYLNSGYATFGGGTGEFSVHHILDVADYRTVTIKAIKYDRNPDGTTERSISEIRKLYKIGATIELPEYEGYTHNIKIGTNAYIKDDTDNQVIEVTYLPLYTPEQLRNTTTEAPKRIALRCIGGSTYNQFYNGQSTTMKAELPLTMDMVFDFEFAEENNGVKFFYLKRAFEEDKYLQTNNPSTFGSKTSSPAKFEICNITTVQEGTANANKNVLNKNDGFYTDTDFMTTYMVRFAKDGGQNYINLSNSGGWPNGIGIWSVQLAVDASCYRKYTLNITKHNSDGTTTHETQKGMQRVGDDIEIPALFGYINNADDDGVKKDETDTQEINVTYDAISYEISQMTPGNYFIYYVDEDGAKHYLQTKSTNNVITVTEGPMFYEIKNGITTNGKYSHAYYLEMNDLRIQNTERYGSKIQTSPADNAPDHTRVQESQVFFRTAEIEDCYAIRLTNSTVENGEWHENYFLVKGEQTGTTMGVNPSKVGPQNRYIWHVDAVTGKDMQVIALRNCLELIRETYYTENEDECLLRDGANYYDPSLLDVYKEALEFYNSITDETTEEEVKAMFDKLEAKRDGTDINDPELNKFYRIRCCDDSQTTPYISAVQANHTDGTNRFTMVALDANDPNTIFFYYNDDDHIGDDEHSHEGTHLVSLSKGRSIECHDFVSVGDASKVAFFAANNNAMCQYNISFTTASHNHEQRWIYGAQIYNLIDGGNSAPPATGSNGYNWQFEEVTTLPIVIKEAGYATLYSPLALTLPENSGLEVYYATATTASDMKLTALEGNVIPAETGVILKGEAGTYMLTIGGEPAETMTNNLLHGTVVPEYIAEEIFVLAQTENGVGMAKAMATEGHANEYINNAFKAYMPASLVQTPGARFLNFNLGGGDETGIEGLLDTEAQSTVTYDLSGRRVLKAAKGLYIVNGQKVVK